MELATDRMLHVSLMQADNGFPAEDFAQHVPVRLSGVTVRRANTEDDEGQHLIASSAAAASPLELDELPGDLETDLGPGGFPAHGVAALRSAGSGGAAGQLGAGVQERLPWGHHRCAPTCQGEMTARLCLETFPARVCWAQQAGALHQLRACGENALVCRYSDLGAENGRLWSAYPDSVPDIAACRTQADGQRAGHRDADVPPGQRRQRGAR